MLPELSTKLEGLLERVSKFMDENIYPNEKKIEAEIEVLDQRIEYRNAKKNKY